MQKYSIFWIEEEFCFHYFYKSEILYRFLNEYLSNASRSDLLAQFKFVTKNIPYHPLMTDIRKYHKNKIKIIKNGKDIILLLDNHPLEIQCYDRYMTVSCSSVEIADNVLFQALKAFHPSFFIIENGTTNSGWITPVKKEILL
ncbi:sporulation inhibitor of replication protein SirA [Aquibacillus albus]|uniref:Sporulation inhibitor of replication protein SirA n=1 Tax=Aquibacillus albus TaxID=1168171 RepID=A0ABS2N1W3_9BACI|nr:sporulation inhibitor of replication protein SirA [Aquibacillus albus]MBM7572124.1 hypothetical protein [Aquibacillus albus]